jgi:hypothetical protein
MQNKLLTTLAILFHQADNSVELTAGSLMEQCKDHPEVFSAFLDMTPRGVRKAGISGVLPRDKARIMRLIGFLGFLYESDIGVSEKIDAWLADFERKSLDLYRKSDIYDPASGYELHDFGVQDIPVILDKMEKEGLYG